MAVEYNDELLNQVKTSLRLSSDNFTFDETQIYPMVNACLCDMQGAGVDLNAAENDFLIRQVIVFYCRANFALSKDDKWQKSYEDVRNALGSRTAVINQA